MNENPESHTEWQQTKKEAKATVLEILEELDRIYGEDDRGWEEKWTQIKKEIIEKLTEAGVTEEGMRKIAAYHELIASTTNQEYSPNSDLPGDLSILKQLKATREALSKI